MADRPSACEACVYLFEAAFVINSEDLNYLAAEGEGRGGPGKAEFHAPKKAAHGGHRAAQPRDLRRRRRGRDGEGKIFVGAEGDDSRERRGERGDELREGARWAWREQAWRRCPLGLDAKTVDQLNTAASCSIVHGAAGYRLRSTSMPGSTTCTSPRLWMPEGQTTITFDGKKSSSSSHGGSDDDEASSLVQGLRRFPEELFVRHRHKSAHRGRGPTRVVDGPMMARDGGAMVVRIGDRHRIPSAKFDDQKIPSSVHLPGRR
ncbi:MAG: hypothetical protein U0326_43525 [Polyangiales bacterium]